MKRPKQHQLEEASKLALRNFLPDEWIVRNKVPDYAIDMEVEIVEDEKLTNKILWIQIKATEILKENISYQMETKYLKYYEKCTLPVLILYWIKEENCFYYLFAQKYIYEELSVIKPKWKEQKSLVLKFDLKLSTLDPLHLISSNGQLYIMQKKIQDSLNPNTAYYWFQGNLKSDNELYINYLTKGLAFMLDYNYKNALEIYDTIFRECTISPKERISVLLNMGVAYCELSEYENALRNFQSILNISEHLEEKDKLNYTSCALGNIGLICRIKGDLKSALMYQKESFEIHQKLDCIEGMASALGNIGLIHYDINDFTQALKYFEQTLKINKDIDCLKGIAGSLGNIGLVYYDKGDFDNALKFHRESLENYKKSEYKLGEALALGNIGLAYFAKKDYEKALKYHISSLKINHKVGNKQGLASDYGNIASVYLEKYELDKALKYLQKALKLINNIGFVQGKADVLGNLGNVYFLKDDLNKALNYHQEALNLHKKIGFKIGIALDYLNIGQIYKKKGEFNEAIYNFKKAVVIFYQSENIEKISLLLLQVCSIYEELENREELWKYYIEYILINGEIDDVFDYCDEFNKGIVNCMIESGIEHSKIYAFLKTERIITMHNVCNLDDEDIQEWNEAVEEYHNLKNKNIKSLLPEFE